MNARSGTDDVRITMEPGQQRSYSNGGYTLLQLAIEEVTGEPFARYMQREVHATSARAEAMLGTDRTWRRADEGREGDASSSGEGHIAANAMAHN